MIEKAGRVTERRKLIEVALPLEAINRAENADGFSDAVRRTVKEDAQTLSYGDVEFGSIDL